jgi:hypothetical protein
MNVWYVASEIGHLIGINNHSCQRAGNQWRTLGEYAMQP